MMTIVAFGDFQKRHDDDCSLLRFSQNVTMTIANFGDFQKRHDDDC